MGRREERGCRPVVVVCDTLADEAARWLSERAAIRPAPPEGPTLADALRDAEGLVVRTATRVDGALLAAAPRLRALGRGGVGLDNIDLVACRERRVAVVYTPDANTQAVVEYVTWLVGDALRPRHRLRSAVDASAWSRLRAETVGRRQLDEMTVGILGLGRIGRRVARVASALGARVLYHDLLEIPAASRGGGRPVAPEALFERSDLLTIHVDGRPSNRDLVGAAWLERLPDDAVLINTSRGFVLDRSALAAFLLARPRAQAHLDVHEPEPIGPDDPLLSIPGAHLYPHLASRTETALRNMSWVVKDVVAVLEGRRPAYPAP